MLLDASSGEQSYEPAAEPMNFYNDIDPKGCAWLGELMSLGLIPPGVIDNRSITDIDPNELTQYTQCHFFAGIGGWPLALRWAGWPDDQPVWTGSCPCQPFSVAGKRKGEADERHLWPAFRDLIAKCAPPVVFGEQVASKDGREWLAGVRADLEAVGYAVGAADLCAAGVGAPHLRQRLYWVADSLVSSAARFGQHCGKPVDQPQPERIGAPCRVADAKHDGRRADEPEREPQGRVVDGRSGGLADSDGRESGNGELQRGGQHGQQSQDGGAGWQRVSFAADCPDGDAETGEPGNTCAVCGGEYSECGFPGPTQDGYEYTERDGILYARRLANMQCAGLEGHAGDVRDRSEPGRDGAHQAGPTPEGGATGWTRFEIVHCRDGKARRFEPGSFPLAHGLPGRVGLLRGYGNAIVPQVAAEFISAWMECSDQQTL